MPIPAYQEVMLPLLRYLGDARTKSIQECYRQLADAFDLTPAEREELIPSGRVTVLYSRVTWAATYFAKAGLVRRPSRGMMQITDAGQRAIQDAEHGVRIDNAYLRRFPGFVAFQRGSDGPTATVSPGGMQRNDSDLAAQTPLEAMELGYRALRDALASDLLDRIKAGTPRFFEHLVLDLLVAMGYGGSRADAAEAVGGSGDGGVDGYIKEDKLGLDSIYLQAKRWEHSVGRPIVQAFAGSLEGHRARKGVLITTSSFSQDAREYVGRIEKRIVLIDGEQLTHLMIDHGVGVADVVVYPVKKIDEDYFEEP
jgi:restriction system protein